MKDQKRDYPFTAIVGQEKMKEALILNLINPSIGGVLIRGEKGTAKSTMVRALVNLLGEREENDCAFHCEPGKVEHFCSECFHFWEQKQEIPKRKGKMKVVNLPVSATEDRVVGSLDIEHAIQTGEKNSRKEFWQKVIEISCMSTKSIFWMIILSMYFWMRQLWEKIGLNVKEFLLNILLLLFWWEQ